MLCCGGHCSQPVLAQCSLACVQETLPGSQCASKRSAPISKPQQTEAAQQQQQPQHVPNSYGFQFSEGTGIALNQFAESSELATSAMTTAALARRGGPALPLNQMRSNTTRVSAGSPVSVLTSTNLSDSDCDGEGDHVNSGHTLDILLKTVAEFEEEPESTTNNNSSSGRAQVPLNWSQLLF